MNTDRELRAFADSLAEKIYGEPRLDQTDCAKMIYEALVTRPEGGVKEVWLRYPENRPPEIFKDYLVAFGTRPEIAVATYCEREDEEPDFDFPEVIAWMPLPDVRSLLPPQENNHA